MDPVTDFLALALLPEKLAATLRHRRLVMRERYWRGTQYEDRPLDIQGYRKASRVYGSGVRTPPWEERDPGAVWNLRGEVVSEITDWTLAGDSWCRLTVADDEAAEDWLGAVAGLTNMSDVLAQARDYGGAMGTAVVSFLWREGRCSLEAHNPRLCWPLAWRDAQEHRPAAVAMVFRGEDPFAGSDDEQPLFARIWTETDESLHERVKNPDGSEKPWRWEEVERVAHSFGFCPVYWYPQHAVSGSHEGTPDGAETEGEIDEANMLFAAAGVTTMRNADDTLVIREDPALNPGNVRKGAFNTIFARGGAEILSQKGESATICMTIAEKRAQHVYRQSGVVMVDVETLKGAVSGESLRRIFQRTLKTAATGRRGYAKGLIVPLAQGLLASARILLARGLALDVPPRVTSEEVLGAVKVEPRIPGKSSFVECVWPDAFPPGITDQKAMIDAAGAATGGKQVMSRATAVAWLAASAIPITSVQEELEAIEADEEAAAERQQTAFGLAPDTPGAAGPIGAKDPAEGEQEAETSGGKVAAE
jgi:hypothetical protein